MILRYFLIIYFLFGSIVVLNAQDNIKVAPIKNNGKWGIINEKGKVLVPSIYDTIEHNNDNLILAKWDSKYGYIDSHNTIRIANLYEYASLFTDGRALVRNNGKYGYIDKHGKVIIDYQYEDALPFKNQVAVVKKYGQYGVVNLKNEFIIKPEYDNILQDHKKYFIVGNGRKSGVIDYSGKLIIPFKYDLVLFADDSLLSVYNEVVDDSLTGGKEGLYGLINLKNESIIPLKFKFIEMRGDRISYQNDLLFFVDIQRHLGLVNKKGKIITCCFKDFEFAGNGYYIFEQINDTVYSPSKYYLVDSTGKLVFDKTFDKIGEVNENTVAIKTNSKFGYFDLKKNEVLIENKYIYASPFHHGKALVVNDNNKLILIDKKDKVINYNIPFDIDFDNFKPLYYNKLIVLKKGDKYGAIDYSGKVIIHPIYDFPLQFK